MLEPYQEAFIDLMQKQELQLAELYTLFAEKFPTYASFWQSMAQEETKHAEWVGELRKAEALDFVAFTEGKTKTYTMKAFIEYVQKIKKQAEDGELDARMAMACTRDLEQSLIEKNVLTHFEIVDQRCCGIMDKLVVESKRHLQKAQSMMETFRKGE